MRSSVEVSSRYPAAPPAPLTPLTVPLPQAAAAAMLVGYASPRRMGPRPPTRNETPLLKPASPANASTKARHPGASMTALAWPSA